MTSPSPRIYLYKITFEEVSYYYYGIHKEKRFNEEYWGTPITHKWCWEFYTIKKQILQVFDYTDAAWLEAQEIEKRLIKPFYNSDKWCLNENCGGKISLDVCRNNGRTSSSKNKKNKVGIFSLTSQQLCENAKKGGKIGGNIVKEFGIGVCGRSKEKMSADGRKGGKISGEKTKELKTGIFSLSKEQRIEHGKEIAKLKKGIHGLSLDEKIKNSSNAGKISSQQKWQCSISGYITNAGALTSYQRKRNIDTTNRIKL
jgi:hypothetical protein